MARTKSFDIQTLNLVKFDHRIREIKFTQIIIWPGIFLVTIVISKLFWVKFDHELTLIFEFDIWIQIKKSELTSKYFSSISKFVRATDVCGPSLPTMQDI